MRDSSCFQSLDDGTVQVWIADLDDPAFTAPTLEALLSLEERRRVARLRFQKDQRRFVAARGSLRLLLGKYLSQPPVELEFSYGSSGKPKVWKHGGSPLHFNLAHAKSCALFAFARGFELGVDVEEVRHLPRLDQIAERFFASGEAEQVRHADPADRAGTFFRCWTRKEAYIKALGDGLSRPLNSFAVSLATCESPRIEWAAGEPEVSSQWSLHHLEPRKGFVGALALRQPKAVVRCLTVRPNDLLLSVP